MTRGCARAGGARAMAWSPSWDLARCAGRGTAIEVRTRDDDAMR